MNNKRSHLRKPDPTPPPLYAVLGELGTLARQHYSAPPLGPLREYLNRPNRCGRCHELWPCAVARLVAVIRAAMPDEPPALAWEVEHDGDGSWAADAVDLGRLSVRSATWLELLPRMIEAERAWLEKES